jgi:glycine/D-amino acid oxidase-like deaminating enzyme
VNAVRKEPEPYHRLNALGVVEYPAIARELGAACGYHAGGSLEWADTAGQNELRERVERLAKRGYAATLIDAADARALEPALAIPDGEVAWFATDGWVDGPRFIATLLDRARAAGATVETATVRELRRAGDRLDAVVTDRGDLRAAHVLLCAGASTQALLATIGAHVPVRRVPGVLAVTTAPSAHLERVIHAPGIHLRPDATGGVLLGATEFDVQVTETTRPDDALPIGSPLLERARRVMPSLADVRAAAMRIGVRPMPEDGHTIAGPVPGVAGAWVIATHSAVTMGPLLGRLIASEIAGAPAHDALAPFRPDRFNIRA